MLRLLARAVAALCLAAVAAPAAAFWDYGHETVADIAQANLTPQARREVDRLLRRAALLETPTCPASTLRDAATWPDCIKGLRDRFSYSSSWHYQNINVCQAFDADAACPDGNCVSAQIERNARLLADRNLPDRDRLMALAFLVHFVGDLHQPLHAGDRGDLGGNRFGADWGVIGGRLNLHAIWDGYLAERAISQPLGEAAGLLGEFGPDERAAAAQGTVTDWARESWGISRDYAYASLMGGEPCGPLPAVRPVMREELVRELVPVLRRQVTRGGLRLARMINEALA